MTNETTTEDMLVAIMDKIKALIEEDPALSDIKKVYLGSPRSIPNYPCALLDWVRTEVTQRHKGQFKIEQRSTMSVVVIDKYLEYVEGIKRMLRLTGLIRKHVVTNRYLNGLRDLNGSWRVIDTKLGDTDYAPLPYPTKFVIYSSDTKIEIVTEGI